MQQFIVKLGCNDVWSILMAVWFAGIIHYGVFRTLIYRRVIKGILLAGTAWNQ